jgi:murein DD-endopeptidase MepM/ murein hydrolase activator NlpD
MNWAMVWLTKRSARLVIPALVAGLMLAMVGGVWLLIWLGAMGGQSSELDAAVSRCAGTPILAAAEQQDGEIGILDGEQRRNAATIVAVGQQHGVPPYGWVVGVATAMQESGLRNLDYGDRDSLGLFQQRPSSGWGTPEQIRDPVASSEAFYGVASHTQNTGLVDISGWQQMALTVAAQAVQRSAFPGAYAQHEQTARSVVAELAGDAVNFAGLSQAALDCATGLAVAAGVVQFPLPTGTYIDQNNYGSSGGLWSSLHTGNDYSAPCGTPVYAVTNGTVIIRRDQPWAGSQLVQVQTAPGKLTTWYAHLSRVLVQDGQQVTAGQPIGQVGSEGNSTGCHLHLEVHPSGAGFGVDDVDPHAWLSRYVGVRLGGGIVSANDSDGTLNVATFNVLGASHTGPGSQRPWLASADTRMSATSQLLARYAIDVVGFQEFQGPQAAEFLRQNPDYRIMHSAKTTQNSVAWRDSRLVLLQSRTLSIPYFGGRPAPQPAVLLQDRVTGRLGWFISVHNPASVRGPAEKYRAEAVRKEIALVRQLHEGGVPVFLVGDFNAKADAFCTITGTGFIQASAGGKPPPGCRTPRFARGIDWIFATDDVAFLDHLVDDGPLVRAASDHPLVVAHVAM